MPRLAADLHRSADATCTLTHARDPEVAGGSRCLRSSGSHSPAIINDLQDQGLRRVLQAHLDFSRVGMLDGVEHGLPAYPQDSDDVAFTRREIDASGGPVILVGHSYGGVVITEAGNDPRVVGLVYIAAFAPDNGESVAKLIQNPPPGASVPPILPPRDGFLMLDKAKFAAAFAADVEASAAEFMAESQVPWGLDALNGAVTTASWKTKPSWYLVATDDRMIPPDAQRLMSKRAGSTVVESPGSHAVYVSRPEPVAKLIVRAASAVSTASTK